MVAIQGRKRSTARRSTGRVGPWYKVIGGCGVIEKVDLSSNTVVQLRNRKPHWKIEELKDQT